MTPGGRLKTDAGTVTWPTTPANFVSGHVDFDGSSDGCLTVLAPPAGRAVVVTQVTVVQPGGGRLDVYKGSGCVPANRIATGYTAGSVAPEPLALGPGIPIADGSELSANQPSPGTATVYAYGYLVDPASVPSGPPGSAPVEPSSP